MQIGWVDYSGQERAAIKGLLDLLKESSTLDELGVGIVRDSISNLLYPGTSVLHTRAKYYILIPELFKKAMNDNNTTGKAVRDKIEDDQDEIAKALRRAIDEETGKKAAGIIGGRSDKPVKLKPARIYWNGLRTMGILCNPALSYDDACNAVAVYNKRKQNIEVKKESDDEAGDAQDALSSDFNLFTAPCGETIEHFLQNPTLHLTKDEAIYLKEQMLHAGAIKNTLMEYCLKTGTVFDGRLEEVEELSDMSAELKRRLMLAQEFADYIYGAYIVYYLVFWENGGDDATEEAKEELEEKYRIWKKSSIGLPHRDEILRLVKEHEQYKETLKRFLVDFEKAVNENKTDECSDAEKSIVKARERYCKREKAKLGKKETPFPANDIASMDYRHGRAQIIISDILKGLGEYNG